MVVIVTVILGEETVRVVVMVENRSTEVAVICASATRLEKGIVMPNNKETRSCISTKRVLNSDTAVKCDSRTQLQGESGRCLMEREIVGDQVERLVYMRMKWYRCLQQ